MVNIDPDKPLYGITVAAELIGVNARTLRIYEENGIITPARSISNRRLYSQKDIDRLEYIHFLTHIKKVNIAGVKVVLELLEIMKDEERQKIISTTEEEIESLSQEKKKIYVEGTEEIKEKIISESNILKADETFPEQSE